MECTRHEILEEEWLDYTFLTDVQLVVSGDYCRETEEMRRRRTRNKKETRRRKEKEDEVGSWINVKAQSRKGLMCQLQ